MRTCGEIEREWRSKYGYDKRHLCVMDQHCDGCNTPMYYNPICVLGTRSSCEELFRQQEKRLLPEECAKLSDETRFMMWKGVAHLMVRQKKGEISAQQIEDFKKTCIEIADYYAELARKREERSKEDAEYAHILRSL